MSETTFPLEMIDRKKIRGFLAQLNAIKPKQAYDRPPVDSYFAHFFQIRLHHQADPPVNPMEDLETPKIIKRLPAPFPTTKFKACSTSPISHSYLGLQGPGIMELFYSSGFVSANLWASDREDFDPPEPTLKLKGKGKKERIVPITKECCGMDPEII